MIDERLARAWMGAFAPRPIIAPSAFAEEQIILPPESPIPGPLRLSSYQKEPIEALADDTVHTIILMWSSQVGKSTIINAMMAHGMANDPGPMLHVSPTDKTGVAFVKEKLDPLIAASPVLRGLIGTGLGKRKGSTGGQDSIDAKSFPGGQLSFASSFIAEELRARSIRYLFLDEVDAYAQNVNGEGDPISLAIKRTKPFEGKRQKIVAVSTPTRKLGSRINQLFMRGDQRRFHVVCPDCNHPAPFIFENLKWTEEKPETAYLTCEECGVVIDEAKRRFMIESGKWVATATGESGVRSYHLDELSSLLSTMAAVAQQFEAAKTPDQKQSFYNTTLARVYDAGTEVELSASDLQQRAETITPPYAANIELVSAGVDVQSDRLECTFLAHHADETFSVLNHLKLIGDTSGDAVWRQLDDAMGTMFRTSDGRTLPVLIQAVDSGFNADQVIKFVLAQRRKSRSAYAVKGRAGFDRKSLAPGGQLKGQMPLLLVGVDAVKLNVQKALALQEQSPGFIRLPDHLDGDYFAGLASEELRVRYVRGTPRYEFHRTVRRNESLDCLVYATAIAKHPQVQKAIRTPTLAPKPFDAKKFAENVAKLNGG